MVKSGYKKFLKQERAKVKLKGKAKTLLPKGQNVTDLNFKVKKIVIRNQLKDHEENEVLSTRKLNIQEVLSRMGHYSANVSQEAVGQLESLLKHGGRTFLSSHLSPIISQLGKLLTALHSHLRKAAIKLLTTVLSQIDDGEWGVVRGVVISYIVCGLSHVDPGVRSDSLLALDACPRSAISVDTLLPPLLDLMSTSRSSGSRALDTHVLSSPTAHRTAVLTRIKSVLSSLQTVDSVGVAEVCDVAWNKDARVPLTPWYPMDNPLSISNFSTDAVLSPKIDLKGFATTLIPLMMDSFAEIAPEPDNKEPVCVLSHDGAKLLGVLADVTLLLYDLLIKEDNDNIQWMKKTFGNKWSKRIIEGRFPYGEEAKKKQRGKASKVSSQDTVRLNLSLSLLTLMLNKSSTWTPVLHYLSEQLRGNSVIEDKISLMGRCLSVCLSQSSAKPTSKLLAALTKVNRSSPLHPEVFSVLSRLYLQGSCRQELAVWLEQLIAEAVSPDEPFYSDSINFLIKAAPIINLPPSFDAAFPFILDKALKANEVEMLSKIGNFLYWMKNWESSTLNKLSLLIENPLCPHNIKMHIINLMIHKWQRYPELNLFNTVNTICNVSDMTIKGIPHEEEIIIQ